MIDVTLLRTSPEVIAASLERRGVEVDLEALADIDRRRRETRASAEQMRARQKELGGSIAGLDGDARSEAIAEAGELSTAYKEALAAADALDEQFNDVWVALPNLTDETAAAGLHEEDSEEISRWGDPAVPDGAQDHVDLGTALGVLDIERAARLSGSGAGIRPGTRGIRRR